MFVRLVKMFKYIGFAILFVFLPNISFVHSLVEGNKTLIKNHPWQASVIIRDTAWIFWWREHKCGGTIIGRKWILSAAHCFDENSTDSIYEVRVGSSMASWWGHVYSISSVTLHGNRPSSDIAIIELADNMAFDDTVKEIRMAATDFTLTGFETLISSGFGRACFLCEFTEDLMEVRLDYISWKDCRATFGRVTSKNICGMDKDKKSTVCRTDSGGPVSIVDSNNEHILVGLVRGGHDCVAADPVVFTYIPEYRDWIQNITGI
ncbi:trypsin-5-like [Bradysia coprophila]|uniref:trypsin-5-like n=1 Tax=Bradysia coprophila TaxID=38358 RepID=UPI00187DA869|nr:trypsin-5-like [Bradysia coprophila]